MPTQIIGDNTIADISGCQDTYIDQVTPDTKYNADSQLLCYGGPTPKSVLIRYTGLDSLPTGIVVEDARFMFYKSGSSSGTKTFEFRRILRQWYILGASWNEWDAGQSWTVPGCLGDFTDRVATISDQLTSNSPLVNEWVTSNGNAQLKQDIENMVNGEVDNNGWIIERLSTDQEDWRSSEALASQRPMLRITYRFRQPGARVGIQKTVVLG